ncbi:MAG: nucleotide exchange factor GrpE [Clostridiales bacterium]|nr:nucleotide exchange factor GrpE [Clostridiales bacterium]
MAKDNKEKEPIDQTADEETIIFGDGEEAEEVNEAEVEESAEESEASDEDKVAEIEKKYMMLYAEYENFRKRTAKEKEQLYADAIADVSEAWLAVVDNIDRALEAAKDINENNYEQIRTGIEGISKGANDIIAKLDIKEIPAERGMAFDPNFHSAVMHVEDDSLGEQEIAQVFQKGYIYKERVIRHAVVQVAN